MARSIFVLARWLLVRRITEADLYTASFIVCQWLHYSVESLFQITDGAGLARHQVPLHRSVDPRRLFVIPADDCGREHLMGLACWNRQLGPAASWLLLGLRSAATTWPEFECHAQGSTIHFGRSVECFPRWMDRCGLAVETLPVAWTWCGKTERRRAVQFSFYAA